MAWEALFEQHHILETVDARQVCIISANEIRTLREPRLMAKFDHEAALPEIFMRNGLTILPVSRGSYCIGRFKAYKRFGLRPQPVKRAALPGHLTTLDPASLHSECVALNAALASGMLKDFSGDNDLTPTVSGRMGSGAFSFTIDDARHGKATLAVDNAQIEIDVALEGRQSLLLIEAKHQLSRDFIIRQLYYPFRTWTARTRKTVRPIFMVYSNDIFRLYEYAFTDADHYNSLELVRSGRYSLTDTRIDRSDVATLAAGVSPVEEPEIPFPQADIFERVINLCELLFSEELNPEAVTEEYDFAARQTAYYAASGKYLGLIEQKGTPGDARFALSREGRRILGLGYKQRQLAFCECILKHEVFLSAFREYLRTGSLPDKPRLVDLMRQSGLYRIHSDNTFARRARTVNAWLHWITELWSC